jgi:hypothetical protein
VKSSKSGGVYIDNDVNVSSSTLIIHDLDLFWGVPYFIECYKGMRTQAELAASSEDRLVATLVGGSVSPLVGTLSKPQVEAHLYAPRSLDFYGLQDVTDPDLFGGPNRMVLAPVTDRIPPHNYHQSSITGLLTSNGHELVLPPLTQWGLFCLEGMAHTAWAERMSFISHLDTLEPSQLTYMDDRIHKTGKFPPRGPLWQPELWQSWACFACGTVERFTPAPPANSKCPCAPAPCNWQRMFDTRKTTNEQLEEEFFAA